MHIGLETRAMRAAFTAAMALGVPGVCAASALVCPVTKIPVASPKAAVGKSTYQGKTYYFCTSNCKRLFDKNPAKYAKRTK